MQMKTLYRSPEVGLPCLVLLLRRQAVPSWNAFNYYYDNCVHITQRNAKTNCDVLFAIGKIHQACDHVTLTMSAWPKYGHRSLVGCRLPRNCSYGWPLQIDSLSCLVFRWLFLSKILTPDQSTSDVILFCYMICYGWHVGFCCQIFAICSCQCSAADGFHFFSMILLPLSITPACCWKCMYCYSCGTISCTRTHLSGQLHVYAWGGLEAFLTFSRVSWLCLSRIFGSLRQFSYTFGRLPSLWSGLLFLFVLLAFSSLFRCSCFTFSKIQFGWPQFCKAVLICSSPLFLSFSVDTNVLLLSINFHTAPVLWLTGWCDLKCRYWSVRVGFRYTCEVSGWCLKSKSRKGIVLLDSSS